jgi:hypothetical protein
MSAVRVTCRRAWERIGPTTVSATQRGFASDRRGSWFR